MAPLPDKRLAQPPMSASYGSAHAHSDIQNNSNNSATHGRRNGSRSHGGTSTRTNVGDGDAKHHQHQQSRKGLEILDFHESWLEEMEIYKDQLYVKKMHQHQMLKGHGHTHGSVANSFVNSAMSYSGSGASTSAQAAAAYARVASPTTPTANVGTNTVLTSMTDDDNDAVAVPPPPRSTSSRRSGKRGGTPGRTTGAGARSGVQTSSRGQFLQAPPAPPTLAHMAAMEAKKNGHFKIVMKRNRTDLAIAAAASAAVGGPVGGRTKRNRRATAQGLTSYGRRAKALGGGGHTNSHTKTQSSHIHNPHPANQINAIARNAQPAGVSSPTRPIGKIIVNQFHASSLLNSQHADEKTKFLAQHGLTKSAANAYAASLYASHVVGNAKGGSNGKSPSPPNRSSPFDHQKSPLRDHQRPGTTDRAMQKGLRSKSSERRNTSPDSGDTIGSIDDTDVYTESDSDEEYKGEPFYLGDDGEELKQSRNIHRNPVSVNQGPEGFELLRHEYYTPSAILSPSLFPNVPPYLNFSSHVGKGPTIPAVLHKVLKWKLSPVMPKIVKRVVLNSGFRIIRNTTDWMAVWEKHMKSPGFRTIRSHQKYNHMPGSFRIGRKDTMWRAIEHNMTKHGVKEFGFMQKSYILPNDLECLRLAWPKSAARLTKWIVKPPASARGTGIHIINKWSQFPKDRPLVVQKYIERPLLINENKFDLRIYVVVTSINPLRIYMYKEGLARFASVKYSPEVTSLDERCMHLTNYSINKLSESYAKNEDFNACQGHKWTLQSLWSCLETRGVNTKRLWATLRNLVVKALISGESGLNRTYRQNVNFRYNCFELFGFDILLDENLVPWLLEINISPSLHSELPLDLHVKGPLIQAVLNTALYQVPPKLNEKQQREVLDTLQLQGPLCIDKRIFTTCLTADEVRKHNQFTNRSIEFREEYVETILDELLPDDIRCLIITEDEANRCQPLERIFPTPDTHIYLKYIDHPRYYNRLLDAWESRYSDCRQKGLDLLSNYCRQNYHLQVSNAAMEKEPNVAFTEIDMLHTRKSDEPVPANVPLMSLDAADFSRRMMEKITIDSANSVDRNLLSAELSLELIRKELSLHERAMKPIKEPSPFNPNLLALKIAATACKDKGKSKDKR